MILQQVYCLLGLLHVLRNLLQTLSQGPNGLLIFMWPAGRIRYRVSILITPFKNVI
jgi:hypothetical protein